MPHITPLTAEALPSKERFATSVDHTKGHVGPVKPFQNGNGVRNVLQNDPHEVDYARPMKVIVVGAGISGILAAIRFPRRIAKLDLVVYDKNPEIGGTWYENRYPGIACGIYAQHFLERLTELIPGQIFLLMFIKLLLNPTPTGHSFTPPARRFSSTGRVLLPGMTLAST